jgi:hypothetical protein
MPQRREGFFGKWSNSLMTMPIRTEKVLQSSLVARSDDAETVRRSKDSANRVPGDSGRPSAKVDRLSASGAPSLSDVISALLRARQEVGPRDWNIQARRL